MGIPFSSDRPENSRSDFSHDFVGAEAGNEVMHVQEIDQAPIALNYLARNPVIASHAHRIMAADFAAAPIMPFRNSAYHYRLRDAGLSFHPFRLLRLINDERSVWPMRLSSRGTAFPRGRGCEPSQGALAPDRPRGGVPR